MKLAQGTILLVVDGAQMMLLRNDGDTIDPDLAVLENREVENPNNRDLLTDAPSIGYARAGYGRDTHDNADPHQENEDRFVAQAADSLTKTISGQRGDVIVIAPPSALGVLRKNYNTEVKMRLIAEIPKDYTNHPVAEIARLVMAH